MRIILKKITALLVLISGINLYQSQLTPSENYVYSKTYLEPVSASSNTAKGIEMVTYFDGLGRPKQAINIKGNPQGNDVVTHIEYDGFGRQVRDYLPVPQTFSANGSIFTAPLDNAANPAVYGSEKIYSEKVLENSPLDRIQQQIQPGNDWQSHPVNYDYMTNAGTDVLKFSTTTSTSGGAFYTSQLKVDGYYAASTLYKNMVADEDGKTTYEFKNGEGQTLLVRKLLGNLDIIAQGIAAPQPSTTYVDTYYVYNEYNQLAFVISPLASKEFRLNPNQIIVNPKTVPNPTIDQLCYQYNYDGRNRLVEKKLPGKGWESMVYDKQDRLIFTQDASLALPGNPFGAKGWLFTKYDQFSRVVYTGFVASNDDRATVQGIVTNSTTIISNNESRISSPASYNGLDLYYSNVAFPTSINQLLSVNYYDTYPAGTPFPDQNKILGVDILKADYDNLGRSTKSLPLASMVKNINSNEWTRSYSFYDDKGRVIGSTSINHLGGKTRVENKLDFAGVVQKTETYHNKTSKELPIKIVEDFKYDHQNRLLKHYHEVVGKTEKELLADNTYDALGRLVTKKVGAVSNGSFTESMPALQTIEYAYNIRGWMTGINLNPTGGLDTSKSFSYKIKYNDPANTSIRKYNGNIAEIDWVYGSNNGSRYEYTYDDLNRLKRGYYKNLNGTTTSDSKHFNEELTYDLNGNIKSLKRNARPRTGQTATLVDNLTYVYENADKSNRLSTVYDNAQNNSGYPAIQVPQPMTYDANGNMLTMPDKGITQNIMYNFLNLPELVTKNNQPVGYTYRADGVKIHKSFVFNNQQIETDYLDGFVYTTPYSLEMELGLQETQSVAEMSAAGQRESFELAEKEVIARPGGPVEAIQSTPSFFATAEGFYDYDNFRYIYQYKDHLGNTRLNFGRDENGVLFTEDSNDYYPFGLNFINPLGGAQQVYNPSTTYKNYKYQEQELQETGFYAFKWRNYMPDVGRFFNIDPLAEKFPYNSTYAFSENRVIDGRELEGLEWVPIVPVEFMVMSNSSVRPTITETMEIPIEAVTVYGRATPPPKIGWLERIGNSISNAWDSITGNSKPETTNTMDKTLEQVKPESIAEQAKPENVMDKVLEGAKAGRETKGKTSQYEKEGGYNQAEKDFESLNPQNVKDIKTDYGTGRTGKLENGQQATSRPGSTDGRPTLEVRNPQNKKGIEIRYNEPKNNGQ